MTAALTCMRCGAELRPTAKFCDECGSPTAVPGTPAEYKQVTVLFADVVGSMDIAAAVGPERLRESMTELVTAAAAVVADVSVPATLQATIAARIDRLGSAAKHTLAAAAVVGSRFNPDLLAALEVDPVVDELLDAELVDQVRFTPRAEYAFRHPLIRTVAYESQLKSDLDWPWEWQGWWGITHSATGCARLRNWHPKLGHRRIDR